MLVRLLYVSRALDKNAQGAIESILESSRAYNMTNGITGVLCYGGDIFLQAIEGGRHAVNGLYNHIAKDERHTNVVMLH